MNHHNIAATYGLEQGRPAGSQLPVEALVLELVEGPTLAERIAGGPLPLDEARAIGMQIAGALEAAHEGGIEGAPSRIVMVRLRICVVFQGCLAPPDGKRFLQSLISLRWIPRRATAFR
jgi:serine/threonine-protein kinase